MGFANSIIGGASALIRAAIRSPNFVSGSTGWSINKDGSAQFNNVVIRNGQVISGTALFYNGPPALGTLICSISSAAGTDAWGNSYGAGFRIGVWSNTTGQMLQRFAADLTGSYYLGDTTGTIRIHADPRNTELGFLNSAGSHLLMSLASQAGTDSLTGESFPAGLSLPGLPLTAGNMIINASGVFVYSGTPALGNLVASSAGAAGTDQFGNAYNRGMWTYGTSSHTAGFDPFYGGGSFPAMSISTGNAAENTPASMQANIQNSGLVNEYFDTELFPPQRNNNKGRAWLSMTSDYKDLSFHGTGSLNITDTNGTTQGNVASWTRGFGFSGVGTMYGIIPGTGGTNSQMATYCPWQNMSLTGGWVNLGAQYAPARFRTLASPANGLQILGVIKSGTITNGTVIWTAPAGYRPTYEQGGWATMWAPNNATSNAIQLDFQTSGALAIYDVPAGCTQIAFNAILALD